MIRCGSSSRPVGLGRSGLHHLVEQPSGRRGKAAVGLLLNRVSNAAAEQVRTECLWRFGPEQLAVALPQLGDGRCRQPIQLGLNGWIGLDRSRSWISRRRARLCRSDRCACRPPSREVRFSFSFFLTTPAKKPRTECCCQSVAFMIASIVVPLDWRSRPSTVSCLDEVADLCRCRLGRPRSGCRRGLCRGRCFRSSPASSALG